MRRVNHSKIRVRVFPVGVNRRRNHRYPVQRLQVRGKFSSFRSAPFCLNNLLKSGHVTPCTSRRYSNKVSRRLFFSNSCGSINMAQAHLHARLNLNEI